MGAGELSVVAAVLVTLLLVVAGVAAFLFIAMGAMWFLRGRSAPDEADAEPSISKKKKKAKVESEVSTVIREPKGAPVKESKAMPAPLTPAAAVRGEAGKAAAPASSLAGPSGFLAPPPPPPFKAPGATGGKAGDAGAGGKSKGPLLGFFDEEKPQELEQKTELFSRDMAQRYAAMLDDEEDEGEHTELFSSAQIDAEMAAALFEDDTGANPKEPGKVVASDKK